MELIFLRAVATVCGSVKMCNQPPPLWSLQWHKQTKAAWRLGVGDPNMASCCLLHTATYRTALCVRDRGHETLCSVTEKTGQGRDQATVCS